LTQFDGTEKIRENTLHTQTNFMELGKDIKVHYLHFKKPNQASGFLTLS
jgi:hypothetical protein